MAFVSLFLAGIVAFVLLVGIPTLIGIIFLIVSLVQRSKQKKQVQKKKSKYIVPGIIGGIFMIPLLLVVIGMIYLKGSMMWEQHNSLAFHVQTGNYKMVEKMLKQGVSPDCTIGSNEPAADGERTVLSYLCVYGGFWEDNEAVDDVVTEEELKMMQLLIDYGADVNALSYKHERDDTSHYSKEGSNPFDHWDTDKCGYTPYLYAVESGEVEIVKLMLQNGSDINTADFCGYTAFHRIADYANDERYAELMSYLIEQGVDVYAVNNYGNNAGDMMDWEEREDTEQIRGILSEYFQAESGEGKLPE